MGRRFGCVGFPLLLAIVFPIAAHSQCKKPGVERWAVKTSLPAAHDTPVPLTLEQLVALPPPASAASDKNNPARFPDDLGNGLHEGAIVRVAGFVRLVATDPDCDYHVQLNASPTAMTGTVIVEVPADSTRYVDAAELRDSAATVREFFRARLLKGHNPGGSSGNLIQGPAYIEVTGLLFFDGTHYPNCQARGKRGMHAATCWEVHPILSVRFVPRPN